MRALAIAALLLGGCTLFDDPPDRSCKNSNDCFRAQGEVCNMTTNQCEVPPDAAPLEEPDGEELEAECAEVSDE